MTPDELDALADKATPGPWKVEEDEFGLYIEDGAPDDSYIVHFAHRDRSDANLIALAPTLARDHAALRRWAEKARAALIDLGACDDPNCDEPNCLKVLAEYDERWSA